MHTAEDLVRIANLGGITASLLKQPAVRKPKALRNVASDGGDLMGTTAAAASAYLYIVSVLGVKGSVPIGSDVNGLAQLPVPSTCCPSTATSDLYEHSGLSQLTTGDRTWNVNVDGMAHYGMLPDLIARWRAEGLREAELAPLLRSAEGYVKTWARAEAAAARIRAPEASAKVG